MTVQLIDAIKTGSQVNVDKASFCMPAIVDSFDAATQTVSVKLAVNEKQNETGEYFDNNDIIIPDVRVMFPASSNSAFLSFPVAQGDTGALIACDCDIDNFISGDGSITDAISDRRHDLTDSFFIPGFFPDSKTATCDDTNIILKNGSMTIQLDPSGKISIAGSSDEVITLLQEAIDKLSTATVATLMGQQPLSCATDLVTIAAKLLVMRF